MLHLISQRNAGGADGDIAGGVLQRMDDDAVAQFVARSIVKERGASGRLAHAFQALVPDVDRQRHLMGLAHEQVAQSEVGQEASFDELWQRVETMVTSYSDENFVSAGYAHELLAAQTKPVDVEQASDDPPERISAWLTSVSDANLRGFDHQLLRDLLMIEQDPARWRDVAETAAAHAESLVRVGYFEPSLAAGRSGDRRVRACPWPLRTCRRCLERFGRAP